MAGNGNGFNPADPLGFAEALRSDFNRLRNALLPRWTATHEWKYHATVYGFDYPGQVLDTDDFDGLPDLAVLRSWVRDIDIKEFGPVEGQRLSTVDKIVITGPEGFKKTYGRFELH